MSTFICVDACIGEPLAGMLQIVSITRPTAGFGRWRRGRAVDPDQAIAELAAVNGDAYVLVRQDDTDPGASLLRRVAAVLGLPVLQLPDEREDAIRIAATAAEFAALTDSGIDVHRAIEVVCGSACAQDRDEVARVRAVRPGVLARWAAGAWIACRWCARGAANGAACPSCGVGIGATR